VLSAEGIFFGEKNGKKIGILLNIAQKDVQVTSAC
jgi:hypothetical protein